MAMNPKEEVVNVIEVGQGTIHLNVLGTSPLICNRMSEKARRELLLPAGRKTAAEKASTLKHDPIAEFRASPYLLSHGPTLIGLMASAFKGAMGTAALDLPGATKAKIGRLVYVEGDYVSIFGVPQLFMSIVRSADINKTPDIRSRVIIPEWACRLAISFVEPVIKQPAVVNLLAAAGITAGVGDWRPEKYWPLQNWALAIAGEAGELCNLVKKCLRGDFTVAEKKLELLNELADIITYCDLAITSLGGETGPTVWAKFDEVSKRIGWRQ